MNPNPILFVLPGNESFAMAMLRHLPAEQADLTLRQFPDGETYVRVHAQVSGRDAVIVCTLDHPDAKLLQLYLLASVLRDLGVRRVLLCAPYLAYMRQDHAFSPGEAVSARYVAKGLSSFLDGLVTVDPHLHRIPRLSDVYSMPTQTVQAAPAIAAWVSRHVPEAVLIGPDAESGQWVQAIAKGAGCPGIVLEKVRRGDRDVEVSAPDRAALHGRTPVLIDDIVSTGGTLKATAARLRDAGLPAPICIAVHALFADTAYEELVASGVASIVTCNTIVHASNGIDVSESVADAIQCLLG